jgi:hypothetical protein
LHRVISQFEKVLVHITPPNEQLVSLRKTINDRANTEKIQQSDLPHQDEGEEP